MKSSHMVAACAAALLVPVLLAAAVFPTAMIDTRELFVWGRLWPLTTHKHPPVMAWLGGGVETLLAANAFAALLVNQILNALAVLYLYLLAGLMVDRERALLFALLFATALYLQIEPLANALNADALQVPVWLAILYHFVCAARTNGWGHWLALGVLAALAVLIKYTAGLLFVSMGAAALLLPAWRRVFASPRAWAAAVLGLVLVAPHGLALLDDPWALSYAEERFWDVGLWLKISTAAVFLAGALMHLFPGSAVLALGLLTRRLGFTLKPQEDDQARSLHAFLLIMLAVMLVLHLALVLLWGVYLRDRYMAPLLGPILLVLAPFTLIDRQRWDESARWLVRGSFAFSGLLLAGGLLFGIFIGHSYMQEPIHEARAHIDREWQARYACGPGYVIGDNQSAHGLSLAGDGTAIGIPAHELHRIHWFEPERLQQLGAIVSFTRPVEAGRLRALLSDTMPDLDVAEAATITLPLLRHLGDRTISYWYFFIPPECG